MMRKSYRLKRRESARKDDAAAVAAVAAVRPAARYEFFTPERYAAVPALTGLDADHSFIHKTHMNILFLTIKLSIAAAARLQKPPLADEHGQGQPDGIEHAVNRQTVRGYRRHPPLRRPHPDENR